MRLRRKISVLLLSSILYISLFPMQIVAIEASQFENKQEFTFSDYELYNEMRSCSKKELKKMGYVNSQINEIKKTSYEELLKKRSLLSEEQLSNLGLTNKQIEILKEYDGGPITSNRAVLLASPTCAGMISCERASSTSIKLTYHWNWSSPPLFKSKDIVALRWSAVNSSGSAINVSPTSRSASVSYYYNHNRKFYTKSSFIPSTDSSLNTVNARFQMSTLDPAATGNGSIAWAKKGSLTVTVKKDGTSGIKFLKVNGRYGHSTKGAVPSMFYSGDVDISFKPKKRVANIATRTVKITNTGIVTEY